MLNSGVGHSFLSSRFVQRSRRVAPYLFLPGAMLAIVSFFAFRPSAVITFPAHSLANPLQLPPGWQAPPTPVDNPITAEKFRLGRQLFYEVALSGDGKTSCGTCHNSYLSFAARGAHAGSDSIQSKPARMVPRLINVAYDTTLTWDGHIHTLEQQVHIAVLKTGDLQSDTTISFSRIANNPAYAAMFTRAFGDATITLDRIAQAIATFERCLISGNSPYDQYLNGDTSAMSASAVRGMTLFFDTMKTNCSDCHNSLGSGKPNAPGQTFSDNNYYRTGTFEPPKNRFGGGGYGFDTIPQDTNRFLDAGRAGVSRDSSDVGKFRTPSLRNVCLTPPFGADGTVSELSQLLNIYNAGGGTFIDSGMTVQTIFNQDPRVKPLNLNAGQVQDLAAFLNSLTDVSFISNRAFQDPGAASIVVDGHIVAGDLSLYPNPAPGYVNVECPDLTGATEASLVSDAGVTVWRRTLASNGKLRLDFAGIANGGYRLELRSGAQRQSANIVLQR